MEKYTNKAHLCHMFEKATSLMIQVLDDDEVPKESKIGDLINLKNELYAFKSYGIKKSSAKHTNVYFNNLTMRIALDRTIENIERIINIIITKD